MKPRMNEMFRTILTGEPLDWQLTNEQRAAFGLPPVEAHWTLKEARIMRVTSHGEQV